MELTRKEIVILKMESKDFDSLMFYLQRSGNKILLEDIDAKRAKNMYDSLRVLMKE